jgi:hypothetical protein
MKNYLLHVWPPNYSRGPLSLEIRNLGASDDLFILSKLSLCSVTHIKFVNSDFDPVSQTKLFKTAGLLPNIVHWEFYNCGITKEILKTFFINKWTQEVQSLIIQPRGLGADLFKILIKWRKLEKLKRFAFIDSKITKEDLELFSQSQLFKSIEYLDLSHNKLYDEGFSEFLGKFSNSGVKGIYLQATGITSKSVDLLLKNRAFSKLEALDLSGNLSIQDSILTLSLSKHINGLKEIYLRNNYIKTETIYDLITSQNFSNVTHLDLSLNFSLKDDFSLALLDKPFVKNLQVLNLENCDLSNTSLKNFSENRHLQGLRVLDISSNPNIKLSFLLDELDSIKFFQNLSVLHCGNIKELAEVPAEIREEYRVNLKPSSLVWTQYTKDDASLHLNILNQVLPI